jgi:hypothetical protein
MKTSSILCLLPLLAVLLTAGCKKTEVIEIHENLVIPGNNPQPYSGVTTLQVQSYVNRLYVDLIGEQPSFEELTAKVTYLQENNLSIQSREVLINQLINSDEYYTNLFNYTSIQLINGVSQAELVEQITLYEFVIQQAIDAGETLVAQYLEYELSKLYNLVNASADLQAGTIDINQYYKRFCDNLIYDEINMGSENFVISCFENLFGRYPTIQELGQGVTKVDGSPAILLLQTGDNRNDFLEIVIHDSEFYVGRVMEQYQSLLLRNPTQIEEQQSGQLMINSGTLEALQLSITKTDEYAGF